MVPVKKVMRVTEWDPIDKALDLMTEHKISALVVVDTEDKPVGILTKTDLIGAYHEGVNRSQRVGLVMSQDSLQVIQETQDRDKLASLLERNHRHHAIVVNKAGDWVGFVSAWDVVAECARDGRAWPWIRTPDGKIHQTNAVH